MAKNSNHKGLDELNWHILEELQKDARLATSEVGRRVGLSAPAVADRIQKMEEQGYIKRYETVLDFDKVGLTIRAFIFFKVASGKHKELMPMVEAIPEVIEWYTVTGNYSILMKVVAASSERLAKIIEGLEEVGETNTSLILAERGERRVVRGIG